MAGAHDDTGMGGPGRAFPQTPVSAILAVRAGSPADKARAFATISRAYWKPVYMHARLRWRRSNEDAKDLTQGFFASALERDLFSRYDGSRAKFRTYVRMCLESYLANAKAFSHAKKRGGDAVSVPFDLDLVEHELQLTQKAVGDPDAVFENAWVQGILRAATEALRSELLGEGKHTVYEVFKRYELDPMFDPTAHQPTYAELAQAFSLRTTDVTNYLASARRRLRKAVIASLRALTSSEAELREETATVLGVSSEVARELCA